MNCKFCNKPLKDSQIYEFLRGKGKGFCSYSCSSNSIHYSTPNEIPERRNDSILYTKKCIVCNIIHKTVSKNQITCGTKCAGVLASKRMKENNPMNSLDTRIKVSKTLKEINHKPITQGGNGRGATIHQLKIYNEITKVDNSFQMEFIEKTGKLRKQFNAPFHYKIDIASSIHMLAIEIDGRSHSSKKVKECDERKTKLLILKGWKVLRLSHQQIERDLNSCVQMVLSMI